MPPEALEAIKKVYDFPFIALFNPIGDYCRLLTLRDTSQESPKC
jgi:hypothetical protein